MTPKGQRKGKNPNHLHMPICQGLVHGDNEQDDMAHDLEGLTKQAQTCTEVGKGKTKEQRSLDGVQVPVHYNNFSVAQNTIMEVTIQFLGLFCPKSIYGMAPFQITKQSLQFKRYGGPKCKIDTTSLLEGSNCKTDLTMEFLGPKTYIT